MPSSINLSKSRFLSGLQCEKRLWFEIHRKELANETDDRTQAIFDQGHLVGEMARKLFPGGVLIAEDHAHIPEAIESTKKSVQNGDAVLFEATAEHGCYLARADILKRVQTGQNEWICWR